LLLVDRFQHAWLNATILPRCSERCTLGVQTLLVAVGLAGSLPAGAATLGDPDSPAAVDVHAFVSQGAIKSTANDYLVDSSSGSFEFSEAGINFTSQLTDRLRVGLQLFAFDLGSLGTFDVRADWFYLDYHFKDWFGVRAGRVKLVYGLYNDISDIDAARTPVLLPESIYPQTNRYYLLAVTGGEVYGYLNLNRGGGLDYHAIGGAIPVELPSQIGQLGQASNINVPYVLGGRLMWETPLEGLRVGVTGLILKLNESEVFPTGIPTSVPLNVSIMDYVMVLSAEYVGHNLWLAAEGGSARATATDNQPALYAEETKVSGGGYGLAAYRITPWLQPAVYYSVYWPDWDVRSGAGNFQDDLSGTLRFDINNYWIVKAEAHYMHGTAILAAPTTGQENWGLFLLKTTAYF
jgi:hypothetical protein